MKIKTPESGVLKACLDLLAAERIWHERRNTLPVFVPTKNGRMRPVKVAENGTADICCTPCILVKAMDCGQEIRYGRMPVVLWVETKSDSGTQRPEQKEFQRQVEEAGHFYIVVRSSDELLAWLKERR